MYLSLHAKLTLRTVLAGAFCIPIPNNLSKACVVNETDFNLPVVAQPRYSTNDLL